MNPLRTPLHRQLFTQLQRREAALRAALEADDSRALQSATGDAEVTDFKEIAEREASSAIEDVQAGHAAAELSMVMAALQRLEDGTYGVCATCGEPIGEPRLLALPQALHCVACQSRLESGADRQ